MFGLTITCWLLSIDSPVYAQFRELKVSTADGDPNDRFGESAAIDGTTAVIGAFRDDDAGFDAGAAYVYSFENDGWVRQEKLTPNVNGQGRNRIDRGLFGSSIDIRDDVIVVGAVDTRENSRRIGAAYIFERTANEGWQQAIQLKAFDAAEDDNYAFSVATNGEYVMIGALDDDHSNLTNAGSVYVYRRNTDDDDDDAPWVFTQKITPDDARQGDSFGWYVAMDGNRAIIGARDVDDRAPDAGAAYIYELSEDGWVQTDKIYASDAGSADSFGEVVAINGDQVIVGARDVDTLGEEAGAAYIFEYTNGQWIETAKLLASDGVSLDRFGNSVAIEGEYAVVSTRIDNDFRGAIYVFQRFSDSWSELAKVVPDRIEAGDLFGQAVSISGGTILSTAKGDDDEGIDAGAAYFYELASTDRGALVALYNGTNGPNWNNRNNWLSGNDINTWFGVSTNAEGRVTELQLGGNNLSGELPAAIGSLPFLEKLVLSDNNLTGAIPPQIENLGRLQTLDLSNNNLGPDLSGELGALSQLVELYLNDNQFAGAVPEKLGSLSNVQDLHLHNNLLEDLPDFSNTGLTQLNEIFLENNRLTFEDLEPNINLPGIKYVPQANFAEERSETLAQGNPLVLQIEVGGANNQYQWKKNGVAIPGANSNSLVIPAVNSNDAGTYTLEVTNSLVPNLTLVSAPINVSVLPIVDFTAQLLSVHTIPPALSQAQGSVNGRLVGSTLTVSGIFRGLESEFSGAGLHIGASNANTDVTFNLTPTFNDQQGAFLDAENSFDLTNEQIIALQSGLFYVEIETLSGSIINPSRPELRGQLYLSSNTAPDQPALTNPANGTEIDLGVSGTVEIAWEPVEDPQGHNVHYLWAFSRSPDFQGNATLIDRIARIDEGTSFAVTTGELDALLASEGIGQGETVTLYHLVAASDGSEIETSDVFTLSVKRSSTNQPPLVANPVEDFVYLLENGVFKLDLNSVFQDPDGDDLNYSAVSSNENTALINITSDTLFITPLAVGQTSIGLSASDGNGQSVNDVFVLTINQSPQVVTAIEDQIFVERGDPFVQDLTLVFFDEDPITFSVESQNALIASAELNAAETQLTITPGTPGATSVEVTAQDNRGGSTTSIVQVIVQQETINPPQSVSENISITFGNPDLETSYRLVGLPGAVDLPFANAIEGTPEVDWVAFRDSGGEGEREQFFVRYDGSEAFTFKPGRGFWLLSKNRWERTASRSTVPLNGDRTFSIELQNGWNIISNPFDIDVPWQAIVQTNDISQSLHRWSGQFVQTPIFSSARSGEAFYFFNNEELTQLKIPYLPVAASTAPPANRPALTLMARSGEKGISSVRLGNHADAKSGQDRLDQIAPPRTFETLSLRAVQPGAPKSSRKRLLSEQFEPADQQGYRYEISLIAPVNQPVTITLEGTEEVNSGEKIVLFDQTLAKRYDLHKNPSVTLRPASSDLALVLLTGDETYISQEAAEILPERVALLPNYPNPFNIQTTIEWTLPEPNPVRLVVYDALGRQVRVLKDGTLDAGHHSVVWDGRNDAGSTLGSGLYFFQLLLPETRLVRSTILRH